MFNDLLRAMHAAITIFVICLCATKLIYAVPKGSVRIKLDSIQNPLDIASIEKCCARDVQNSNECRKTCSVYVLICLTGGMVDHRWSCRMDSRVALISDHNSIDMGVNGTMIDFQKLDIKRLQETTEEEKEEKVFLFRIRQTRRDETQFRILVRFIYVPENEEAVEINEYVNIETFKPHGIWRKNETKNPNGPNLKYSLHVKCDDDYGSDSCSYQCVPTDHIAHFDCDENKRLICHPGWTGEVCTIPKCEQGCYNGWCIGPSECWCKSDWQGEACDMCRTKQGCVHGTCQNPSDCNCNAGWTGENCDQRITCEMNPCKNEGTCINNGDNSYSCVCADGLSGKHCEKDIKDNCEPFPCTHNDAVCIDKPLGYECECPIGWTGVNCTAIDACSLNPCVNFHECHNIGDGYYCSCKHGWSGRNCTKNSNDCKGQCQNDAICVDEVNGYSCICKPGYSGKNCEIDNNECAISPCLNQGVCRHGIYSYECICQTGFSGVNCTITIDHCKNDPCMNGGSCTTHHNDHKCHCNQGWTGQNCEKPLRDTNSLSSCRNDLCRHRSTCYLQSGQEKCLCPEGYKGRFCQTDIDDCLSNPCENAGTCVDRVNSYQCVCPTGFKGENCEININECEVDPCQNGGVCIDGVNTFTCECPPGYRGHDCSHNVNDCINVVCENDGKCSDEINGYLCKCKDGYMGKHCELRSNQCLVQSCVHGKCLEQDGGFACVCDLGYIGEFCDEEINECIGVVCQNGASCIDKIGRYECNCSDVFYGLHCEYVDACVSNVCGPNGNCVRQGDGYECLCSFGYFGESCEQVIDSCMLTVFNSSSQKDELVPNDECGQHGDCVSLGQSQWKCKCHTGWTGDRCNININDCVNNWCLNSATCMDGEADYTCLCAPGYTGKYCEVDIRQCRTDPCQNGGSCLDLLNDFNCTCIDGWKGKTCNSKLSHCEPQPCLNGGTCIDLGVTFNCTCSKDFVGPTCAQPKDHCDVDTCLNGGTCLNTISSFLCICSPGYDGKRCENNIDECQTHPCQNGGLCIDKLNNFECECAPGYIGKDCSYHKNMCHSNPCPPNTVCQNNVGSHQCLCPEGKSGLDCKDETKGKSCIHNNQTYQNGSFWKDECNQCSCKNGSTFCNDVNCGVLNCFERRFMNCTCREVFDVDCITPPCARWGECVTFKTASIMDGGCVPTIYNPNLNEHCSTLNIKFEKARLPKGILVQEICKELRYSSVLQTLKYGKILLDCRRFTHDANSNELVVSVYVKKNSMNVATLLANHFMHNARQDSVLQVLNRTVTKVYVQRYTDVKYGGNQEFSILLPLIGGLILASLLILLTACVIFKIRQKRYNRYKEESFFTQQQNVLGVNGQFRTFEGEPSKNKKCNIKASLHQQPCKNVKRDSLSVVNDNEYLPDKLYLSEPNSKFSHC